MAATRSTTFFERLRYRALRLGTVFFDRLARRFSPAGRLTLTALIVCSVQGIDTYGSLVYQGFGLLAALFLVCALSGLLFRPKVGAFRTLPRFGTVGRPLPYSVTLTNHGSNGERGLSYLEERCKDIPTLEEFRRSHGKDDPWDTWGPLRLSLTMSRWRRLLRRSRRFFSEPLPVPDLPPGPLDLSCELTPTRRGRLDLGAALLGGTDPFGLIRFQRRVPLPQTVLILPKRYPAPRLPLPGRRRYQHGGVALSSSVGDSQEFVSLRDYKPGDPLRKIHWRSWAKTGKPIVKEDQDEFFVRHALVLDTFVPEESLPAFEEAVSVAASFASTVLTQESLLDLLFVGAEAYCFTGGRGLGGAGRMLEILACVEPCEDKPFEELRHAVLRRHTSISGAICVLLAFDEPRRAFVEQLRSVGVPVTVFLVAGPDQASEDEVRRAGWRRLEPGRIEEGLALS